MTDALSVKGLSKKYKDFELKDVSFSLEQGAIMGFIGENGAGKSTTIKAMLDLIKKDSGEVFFFGKKLDDSIKENIGVVFDECCLPIYLNANDLDRVFAKTYKTWDSGKFSGFLKKYNLPDDKEIEKFSKGMKMKLSIAVALSHDSKVLILDEATSGLDPIVRDEILDEFLSFIQDSTHSVFISSHIVSDLEKICDYITFIHKGKIIFSENKDELLESYSVVKCSNEELKNIDPSAIVGKRENKFSVEALVKEGYVPNGLIKEKATIEDIMLYYVKGDRKWAD